MNTLIMGKGQVKFDSLLFITAILLLCLGIVVIDSASVMESFTRYGDEFYQTKKHLFAVGLSLFCAMICAMIPSKNWQRFSLPLMFVVLLSLILVLIVGREINDAKRWINLGFMNVQPAEFLKLCWIVYFASYTSRKIEDVSNTIKGFLKPIIFIAVMAGLLLAQPDFGSTMVIMVISFSVLFAAGAGLLKYVCLLFAAAAGCFFLIVNSAYRMRRMMSFMNPWEDQFNSGYQLTQSLIAYGRGGLFGEGLGNSIQKLGYLPEAHTDFVTAIIGEEFGFVGMVVLILLEFIIVFKAVKLGLAILREDALFQGYVAYGIGVWFAMQTVINIGVASGALPTKGLTLPLISYGGSSLIVCCCAIAILLRIDYEWRAKIFMPDKKKTL